MSTRKGAHNIGVYVVFRRERYFWPQVRETTLHESSESTGDQKVRRLGSNCELVQGLRDANGSNVGNVKRSLEA
jgi:hypothetical protein